MIVYIAEKPSLARAIFEGLGGNPDTQKADGYYQHNDHYVTYCVGHLMELFDPEDYDDKYAKWAFDDLPIATQYPPQLKAKPKTKSQLQTVLSLIKKADTIVHAGDPDDEGQLLVDEVLNHAGNTKPVQRLLIADLNLAPVQKALASMESNEKYTPLGMSALARSLGDQSFGYNLTRACTLKGREKGFQGTLNVGRVQSAVLGLVNERTLANQNHRESFYYDVYANFDCDGHLIKAKYNPTDNDQVDDKKRLISESNATFIQDKVKEKPGLVTLAVTKPEKKLPPQPLNLSTLQQLCAKAWGYSAENTLKIAQSLYETHKLLTYPRTDNRFLSDEHYYQSSEVLEAISATNPSLNTAIIDADTSRKHKAFNTEKIEAHHAIIPTTKHGNQTALSQEEQRVYELVSRYFIGLFYAESVRDKTKVMFEIEGYQFYATQSILVEKGWEILHSSEKESTEESQAFDLSTLKTNSSAECIESSVDKKKTKPPKYFTESTLLSAMTRAASFIDDPSLRAKLEAKDKDSSDRGSIGTEATRASILGKLASNTNLISVASEKGYKEKVWKTTKQGQEFCQALPKEIIKPDISAIWAEKQAFIKSGDLTVEAFIQEVDSYIAERIEALVQHGINITANTVPCPACGKALISRAGKYGKFWSCTGYPECDKAYPDKQGKPDFTPRVKPVVSQHQCPTCSKGLVRRKASRGKGKYFWGCSGYPECSTMLFDRKGRPDFNSAPPK
ncbi:DNA topoisomerase 3 [Vibrio mediterranei]|uniref:DNA topoisomerase n=1 Tax=Vibrio mediterranei TaxID=689 RepID=A0ABX5DHL3_9VIBR|nr:DNA topoisomerase 3 [Vibrio mediterranei]PCD85918.1 DNA topoisomerase III [Vibrio mediterranei]PRQ68543.1 DNA topoisomerase III [Vibrio mediterranei]